LSARTEEFRDKSEVLMTKTTSHELNVGVQSIFGITPSGEAEGGGGEPGVQAVIDQEPERDLLSSRLIQECRARQG
jgi:hypothetical protein